MKKDQSKIHLLGNKNGKRILLIHGMGFNWKNCFDKLLHILGKNYYFIIPELSGHNASSNGAVTSVILSADYISAVLLRKGIMLMQFMVFLWGQVLHLNLHSKVILE